MKYHVHVAHNGYKHHQEDNTMYAQICKYTLVSHNGNEHVGIDAGAENSCNS